MPAPRPLNWNATLVLQALTQGHGYGFEIMNATLLPSGTVYPILRRLEAGELVDRPGRTKGMRTPKGVRPGGTTSRPHRAEQPWRMRVQEWSPNSSCSVTSRPGRAAEGEYAWRR